VRQRLAVLEREQWIRGPMDHQRRNVDRGQRAWRLIVVGEKVVVLKGRNVVGAFDITPDQFTRRASSKAARRR
jgi:hypothetical protein